MIPLSVRMNQRDEGRLAAYASPWIHAVEQPAYQPRSAAGREPRFAAHDGAQLGPPSVIDIITAGQGDIGGVMEPAPAGLWGMPSEMLNALPGYDPDLQKNRAGARQIMQTLGYGPDAMLVSA